MSEHIMEFEELLEKELDKELEKIINTGTISPDNIKTVKDAFKLKKLMKECEEMEGYSSRRGRSKTTGRYMSRNSGRGYYEGSSEDGMSRGNSFGSYDGASYRDGYSGHGMMNHLEMMLDEAKNEKERRMIEEWMAKAEKM